VIKSAFKAGVTQENGVKGVDPQAIWTSPSLQAHGSMALGKLTGMA
jgi:hypothetical protein